MKNFLHSKKVLWSLSLLALAVTSCYKISELVMPHEIGCGEEFSVSATLIHDDDGNDSDSQRYCCMGVLVPEGWEVSIPDNALEYYVNNYKAASMTLVPNEIYTNIMNYRYPKEGYVWMGYSTGVDGDAKTQLTLHKDLSDKIVMNIKVKAGNTPGDYQLEFLFGDEEDGFNKYADNMTYNPDGDNRLFECGTIASPDSEAHIKGDGSEQRSIHNVFDADTSIKVSDSGSVEAIPADAFAVEATPDGMIRVIARSADAANAIVTVYGVDGTMLGSRVLTEGETLIEGRRGACVVELLQGARKAVRKVMVK